MKLALISDLHGQLPPSVPEADLHIFAGDICPDTIPIWRSSNRRTARRTAGEHQLRWLRDTFVPWVEREVLSRTNGTPLAVFGNHDYVGEECAEEVKDTNLPLEFLDHAVDVANARIIGPLRMVCLPYCNWINGAWAFERTEKELEAIFDGVMPNTDVLVVHGPMYGVRDVVGPKYGSRENLHVGSKVIRTWVDRYQPKLYINGHIHEEHGEGRVGDTKVLNVSYLDDFYKPKWGWTEVEV